jgi:2-oxo-4-hydroxy-4-carboxy--5-ureidoimidazoline (OHCU) decarboxylase
VGLQFEGNTRATRRQNELTANHIIRELQQEVRDKITRDRVDQAIELLRAHPEWDGTKGAAHLAKALGERSNLGQATWLVVLNAAKGVIDREAKLQTFVERLMESPEALIEWFVFGRVPYLEKGLMYHYGLKFDNCRNLVLSARRTLDSSLPEAQQLHTSLPAISTAEFLTAIKQFAQQIHIDFARVETLSANQQQFLTKLHKVAQHRDWLAEHLREALADWNHPTETTPCSRWRWLKQVSETVHTTLQASSNRKTEPNAYVYLSVLRGILVSALLPHYCQGETVKKLRETQLLRVEHLVAKPFRKNRASSTKLLPLPLVMGSKYVVGRPGNNAAITDLLRQTGTIPLQIWRPHQKKHALTATLRVHPKLREFLTNGATLKLLVLRSGRPPAGKLRVAVVLEGHYWMFLSRTAIERTTIPFRSVLAPIDALGLDINRPGVHMLTLSEPILLTPYLLRLCHKYHRLGDVIGQLGKAVTRATRWRRHFPSVFSLRYYTKMTGELARVHAARARCLAELHHASARFVSSVLVQTGSPLLCAEDLSTSARNTRGALAKVILAMPDQEELYTRAVLLASYIAGCPIELRKVNPAYTSQGVHRACSVNPPGRIIRRPRQWDYAECSRCHQQVNTHREAADHIRELGLALAPLHDSLVHWSLSACPAAPLSS